MKCVASVADRGIVTVSILHAERRVVDWGLFNAGGTSGDFFEVR